MISVVFATIPPWIVGQEMVDQVATAINYQYTPRQGKQVPHFDFILPSIDGGKMIQLSNYRGKKVLLLHFASW